MPFEGIYPYGTPGGLDEFSLPQSPPTFAKAEGPMYTLILRTNGTLVERNRENVEDVIRVIGLRGESLAGIIVRHAGGVADPSVIDMDMFPGFLFNVVAPGIIEIDIGGLTDELFAAGAITIDKMAVDSVDTVNILDLAVTGEKIADGSIDTFHIVDGSLTTNDFADGTITPAKLSQSYKEDTAITPSVVYAENTIAAWAHGALADVTATCPGGYIIIGGGYRMIFTGLSSPGDTSALVFNAAWSATEWRTQYLCAPGAGLTCTLNTWAVCIQSEF